MGAKQMIHRNYAKKMRCRHLAAPHFYEHISLLFLCGIHFADGLDDHAGQCEQG